MQQCLRWLAAKFRQPEERRLVAKGLAEELSFQCESRSKCELLIEKIVQELNFRNSSHFGM